MASRLKTIASRDDHVEAFALRALSASLNRGVHRLFNQARPIVRPCVTAVTEIDNDFGVVSSPRQNVFERIVHVAAQRVSGCVRDGCGGKLDKNHINLRCCILLCGRVLQWFREIRPSRGCRENMRAVRRVADNVVVVGCRIDFSFCCTFAIVKKRLDVFRHKLSTVVDCLTVASAWNRNVRGRPILGDW